MKIFIFSIISIFLFKPAFATQEYATSSLSLISGPDELCAEGTLSLVGEKNDATLMVGSVISFSLDPADSVVLSANGKCREVTKKKIHKNKISQITTTSNCPVELKNLERTTLQELEILPEQVIYKHTEGSKVSTCLFKRKLK